MYFHWMLSPIAKRHKTNTGISRHVALSISTCSYSNHLCQAINLPGFILWWLSPLSVTELLVAFKLHGALVSPYNIVENFCWLEKFGYILLHPLKVLRLSYFADELTLLPASKGSTQRYSIVKNCM